MKKGLLFLICLLSLTGCSKNYAEVSSSKFTSTFTDKKFVIIDHSYETETFFDKNIEAGKKNVEFYFIKYKTTKEAEKYMKETYKNNKSYKYEKKGKTIVATDKGIKNYTRAINVNKTVIIAKSKGLFAKLTLKNKLRALGY